MRRLLTSQSRTTRHVGTLWQSDCAGTSLWYVKLYEYSCCQQNLSLIIVSLAKIAAEYTDVHGTLWQKIPTAAFTKKGKTELTAAEKAAKVPFNGWSNEGLLLFNEVCDSITKDRIDCPDFDDQYKGWAQQYLASNQSSKRKRREVVAVFNELGTFSIAQNEST